MVVEVLLEAHGPAREEHVGRRVLQPDLGGALGESGGQSERTSGATRGTRPTRLSLALDVLKGRAGTRNKPTRSTIENRIQAVEDGLRVHLQLGGPILIGVSDGSPPSVECDGLQAACSVGPGREMTTTPDPAHSRGRPGAQSASVLRGLGEILSGCHLGLSGQTGRAPLPSNTTDIQKLGGAHPRRDQPVENARPPFLNTKAHRPRKRSGTGGPRHILGPASAQGPGRLDPCSGLAHLLEVVLGENHREGCDWAWGHEGDVHPREVDSGSGGHGSILYRLLM
uniref:Serine/arginine repetitive matrix protein 1 n=1 Tax=uncultured marine virus TaxID=186617 RepID=A0A0F7L7X4_9VIRU|nr:Serine/arginine repetitive matrix protein 1 [uncultured marine virus]